MGRIDILVNNAGLTRDNLFMRMSDEDWQLVLDVNLSAGFKLAKAAIRGMMKRRYGRIIGIASVVGVMGNAGQANYSASKAGMIAMNKCLAQEVGSRGVTVNSIAPGFIRTPMTDCLPDDVKAQSFETKFRKANSAKRRTLPTQLHSSLLMKHNTSQARHCTLTAVWL